ncbi:NrdH-redoxin [Mycobacterium sp. M1]|uniref:NrdH-redoxin n=1 Tax=Mycolicibacter acidiphilus TaxID=2835306 RepID=A0ABS5RL81_9MYCO|nr:glutaredoxin domain-containing protein [Mycolicibacter acidiphilus]MBS9535068.1 NrdH-redoxin [Mycolicibacter acidiphilus]
MSTLTHPDLHVSATVFTSPGCVQCDFTKRHLDKLGVAARFIDVSESPDAAAFLRAEGFASLPVVFPADNRVPAWTGFRPVLLDKLAKAVTAA